MTLRLPNPRLAFFYLYIACTLGLNAVVLIPTSSLGEAGDNTVFSLSWVLLHMVSLVVLVTSKRLSPVPLTITLGIGGFMVLSAAWSVSWMDSLVYGAMAAGNILMAYVLASEFSLKQIARMILRVLVVMTLAGVLAALVGYQQVFYFDSHGRPNFLGTQTIRGFFQHHIMAGLFGAIGGALSLSLLRGVRRIVSLGVFVLFVLMAGSATGAFLMAAAVVLVPLAKILIPRVSGVGLVISTFPVGVLVTVLTTQLFVPVVELLGRDPTLTGRTVLWEWGYAAISERPILGWGFAAYFRSEHGAVPSLYVPEFFDYEIAHFHNSYIQTAVDLGLIGVLVLLLVLLFVIRRAYSYARTEDIDTGTAVLMTLAVFLIASPTEFLFLNYNHFGTFALFTVFFALLLHARSAPAGDARQGPDSRPNIQY